MPIEAREITGGFLADPTEGETLRGWLKFASTGEEYGRLLAVHRRSLASLWGVMGNVSAWSFEAPAEPIDQLQRVAMAMAQASPFVIRDAPPPVALTDNLIEDVQRTTGLTYGQIAQLFGISERAVAGWKQVGVPRHRESLLRALRAIGLILVGSLGSDGVSTWLRAGNPSRLQRLAAGDLDAVVEEARDYEFSPAT